MDTNLSTNIHKNVQRVSRVGCAQAVDFVVCTRNNREIVGKTLDAIAAQTLRPASCVVVDGSSTDGTPDFVRTTYPFSQVLVKERDSGPAASRNLGMAQGVGDWIVLVDSDVELMPDWTERQVEFLERTGADIGCGKLLYESRPNVLHAAWGAMNRYGVGWDGGVGEPSARYTEPKPCLWAISAAMIVRRRVAQAIGGFDELLFAGHEDCDFGWRANLYGYRVVFNPLAVAKHRAHATFKRHTMDTHRRFLVYRNRLRSALVNYEAASVARYMSVYVLLALGETLRPPRWVKIEALLWNLKHLGGTLRRRHMVQQGRTVSDRELWPLFSPGFRGPGGHMK